MLKIRLRVSTVGSNKINMDYASKIGDIEELERLKSIGETNYSKWAIAYACSRGHIAVLEWWFTFCKTSGLELKYTESAMDLASWAGCIKSLDWWITINKEYGLELKYSSCSITWSSETNDVLEWWLTTSKKSGLPIKYDNVTLKELFYENRIFLLNHLISMDS